jgi:trans-2,3-dihydro-3-hydroxyanthranilate isomerase
MPQYSYHLVDVFTTTPFGGNPLAVFLPESDDLPDETTMQLIAKEMNLSETTFVLPSDHPGCDVRVRIFTPKVELPMAGHPTVGTAFVLAHIGQVASPSDVTFEEGVGPIPVEVVPDAAGQITATMDQLLPTFGEIWENHADVAELVGLTTDDLLGDYPLQEVSTGVPFLYIPVKDIDALGRARLRYDLWEANYRERLHEIFLFTPAGAQTVRSRMFAPGMGIPEDPATGAASGPLGAYLVEYGLAQPGAILSQQGVEMGRPSEIRITIEKNDDAYSRVRVGGNSVYMGQGTLHVP